MNIYVLKLECDKYYIGKTDRYNINLFLDTIIKEEWSRIEWLKLYKPKYIIKTYINKDFFYDEIIMYRYMKKYGIENVRGGIYTDVILSQQIKDFINKKITEMNTKNTLFTSIKQFFRKKVKHKEVDKLYYQL